MNRPQPDPAMVALAREVERLTARVAELETVATDALRQAESAQRVLPELADRIAAVKPSVAPSANAGASPSSWLAERERADAKALVAWINRVLIHYPGMGQSLGVCWPFHSWIVEELFALHAAWVEAYQSERASGSKVVDWHDRMRPSVAGRIGAVASGCSVEAHRPGGRMHTELIAGDCSSLAETWVSYLAGELKSH